MACTGQHAAILCIKRIDVTWTSETFRTAVGVSQGADGGSTVMAAHARGATFKKVDGHGERRAQHTGVFLHLMFEFQLVAALDGDRCTEHTATIVEHIVHLFGGDHFSGHDEVAFVFPVLVIHHDNELTVLEVLYGLFDGGELK